MSAFVALSIVLYSLVLGARSQATPIRYRLCVPVEMQTQCISLQRQDSRVSCVRVLDSTDCTMKMLKGEADFGLYEAEQALLVSSFVPENSFMVMGEARDEKADTEEFAFTAVAIARRQSVPSGNVSVVKRLKLCHPGVGRHRTGWSDRVLKEMDLAIVESKKGYRCDEWRSESENEMASIAAAYGPSCRPGVWSPDIETDKRLKSEMSSLCELCPDNGTCTYGRLETDSHAGAVECLLAGGDIAFTDTYFAKELIMNITVGGEKSRWALVCPDLSLGTNESVCHWARQPWSGIAARKEIAEELAPLLFNWLHPLGNRDLEVPEPEERKLGGWQRALIEVLLDEYQVYNELTEQLSIKTFVTRGRKLPQLKDERSCTGHLRWCIREQERSKCDWLATASLLAGVVPPIKCDIAEDSGTCALQISNHQADLTLAAIDDAHIAISNLKIDVHKYVETSTDRNKNIVALVKSSNSQITNITQLRDLNACFPIIDGVAYGTFLQRSMAQYILPFTCPYGAAVDEFFKDSCVPGANKDSSNPRGLCTLCKANETAGDDVYGKTTPDKCAANPENSFYGDAGALRCLLNGGGNVAFVDVRAAREAFQNQSVPGMSEQDVRLVCENDGLSPGLQEGENCALSVAPVGAALVRESETISTWRTIDHVLQSVDELFGLQASIRPAQSFRAYRLFNGTTGLIYPEGTIGILPRDSQVPSAKGFLTLMVGVDRPCGEGSYNGGIGVQPVSVMWSVLLFLVYKFLLE